MDQTAFDHLTRALHTRLHRRRVAAVALGGPIAALGITLATPTAVDAKKKRCPKSKKHRCGKKSCCKTKSACCKKKCCKTGEICYGKSVCASPFPCPIIATGTTWTLTGDCTLSQNIVLPTGVSLNGGGYLLTLNGHAQGYNGVVLAPKAASNATLSNLTIDAAGMDNCGPTGPTIIEWPQGSVKDVGIINVRCDTDTTVAVLGESKVDNLLIILPANSPSSTAASLTGGGGITGSTIMNARTAIASTRPSSAAISGNYILSAVRGIELTGAGSGSTVHGNTIIGRGEIDPTPGPAAGILLSQQASATITSNNVSNFVSTHPNQPFDVGCGIRAEASAGPGAISGSTFPSPPNEADICDLRLP